MANGNINVDSSLANISWELQKILRIKSLQTLKITLGLDAIKIGEINNKDDFLYGQMMGYILIHGRAIKASLKIHYAQNLAQSITAEKLGLPLNAIDQETTDDFMREYCNLTAGYFADTLAHNNINVDISIPLITDGFDEVWFSDKVKPLAQKDYWSLAWEQGAIICTIIFQIKDLDSFGNIKMQDDDSNSPKTNEGITFL